jgi:hypothetical protein
MSALTPAIVNDIFHAFLQSPSDNVGVGSQDQFSTGGHPTD